MQNNAIIITTINKKNEALNKFSLQKKFDLIIVGDKKSPKKYNLKATYLDVYKQKKIFPNFEKTIPYNHYARKNLGYLYAIKNNYKLIAESDDDNIPIKNWGILPKNNKYKIITSPKIPNIYKEFTKIHVWPRGYPLELINKKVKNLYKKQNAKVLIWQGLVNNSPDVDAIFRLTNDKPITFKQKKPIILDKKIISPFNSQNTFWLPKAYCFLYLPHTVTFRYTDILRSFIAQYGIWARKGKVGFFASDIIQKRNFHNYIKDFIDEFPMYTTFHEVIKTLDSCRLSGKNTDLLIMYQALKKNKIVKSEEIKSVKQWLRIISKYV